MVSLRATLPEYDIDKYVRKSERISIPISPRYKFKSVVAIEWSGPVLSKERMQRAMTSTNACIDFDFDTDDITSSSTVCSSVTMYHKLLGWLMESLPMPKLDTSAPSVNILESMFSPPTLYDSISIKMVYKAAQLGGYCQMRPGEILKHINDMTGSLTITPLNDTLTVFSWVPISTEKSSPSSRFSYLDEIKNNFGCLEEKANVMWLAYDYKRYLPRLEGNNKNDLLHAYTFDDFDGIQKGCLNAQFLDVHTTSLAPFLRNVLFHSAYHCGTHTHTCEKPGVIDLHDELGLKDGAVSPIDLDAWYGKCIENCTRYRQSVSAAIAMMNSISSPAIRGLLAKSQLGICRKLFHATTPEFSRKSAIDACLDIRTFANASMYIATSPKKYPRLFKATEGVVLVPLSWIWVNFMAQYTGTKAAASQRIQDFMHSESNARVDENVISTVVKCEVNFNHPYTPQYFANLISRPYDKKSIPTTTDEDTTGTVNQIEIKPPEILGNPSDSQTERMQQQEDTELNNSNAANSSLEAVKHSDTQRPVQASSKPQCLQPPLESPKLLNETAKLNTTMQNHDSVITSPDISQLVALYLASRGSTVTSGTHQGSRALSTAKIAEVKDEYKIPSPYEKLPSKDAIIQPDLTSFDSRNSILDPSNVEDKRKKFIDQTFERSSVFAARNSLKDTCIDLRTERLPVASEISRRLILLLISEVSLELMGTLLPRMLSSYHIQCVDGPIEEPISIILSATSCISILDIRTFINYDTEPMDNLAGLQSFIRQLTTQAFKWETIWIVVVEGKSLSYSAKQAYLLSIYKAIARFPPRVVIRIVEEIDNDFLDLLSTICKLEAQSFAESNNGFDDAFYDRSFLQPLVTLTTFREITFMAQCKFLQRFPTINLFLAAFVLFNVPLKSLINDICSKRCTPSQSAVTDMSSNHDNQTIKFCHAHLNALSEFSKSCLLQCGSLLTLHIGLLDFSTKECAYNPIDRQVPNTDMTLNIIPSSKENEDCVWHTSRHEPFDTETVEKPARNKFVISDLIYEADSDTDAHEYHQSSISDECLLRDVQQTCARQQELQMKKSLRDSGKSYSSVQSYQPKPLHDQTTSQRIEAPLIITPNTSSRPKRRLYQSDIRKYLEDKSQHCV